MAVGALGAIAQFYPAHEDSRPGQIMVASTRPTLIARRRVILLVLITCSAISAVASIGASESRAFEPATPSIVNDSPLMISGPDLTDEESAPGHIRDNAFLVEEAFNQEPGDVQHIFNWITLFDWPATGKTRDFGATYTIELPLWSQKHQFSSTTQMLSAFEEPLGGPASKEGGIGDTFLNYRYQLLDNDEFLWSAPRFSLILPTGDKRFGTGTGEVGYQFNWPFSRYTESFDFHFNAGTTLIPQVSLPLGGGGASPPQDLRAYNLGASAFWKPETYLHFFVEGLFLWGEEIDDLGFRNGIQQAFVNPGVRYAVCQFDEVEWVIGVSVPIGLTEDSPDFGVFAYMSVEHIFRKVD